MSRIITERRLERKRTRYNLSANWLLFWFQILGLFLVLNYDPKSFNMRSLTFAIALIVLSHLSNFLIKRFTLGEPYFILITNMLFSIGILMIYRLRPELGEKQLMFYALGIVCFFLSYFVLKLSVHFWKHMTWFFYLATIALIVVTILFGRNLRGATNWIVIAGIQFQPGEFSKLTYAFFLASYYTNMDKMKGWFASYLPMILTYALMGLFVKQTELGTAAVIFAAFVCTQLCFDRKRIPVVLNILFACVGLFLAYKLFRHVRVRFDIWLNPWEDAAGKGYQIVQSLFSVSAGGLFGRGLGLGNPQTIPFSYSDFLFSALIEEMGIFMGIGVLLLYLILFYRGLKVSLNQPDRFYRILSLTVSMIFVMQAFVVIGGVLKVIPLTGMTLPFMAHGGSSLLTSFLLLGVLQFTSEPVLEKEEKNEANQ
ncbi:FtsW/RodA/SpoVE family cell cycle protein [Guggenheimella bovis]